MKRAFICDHCPNYDRKLLTEEEAKVHEKSCIWNPEFRHCLTCKDFGMVKYTAVDTYGRSWPDSTRGCTTKHNPINAGMLSNCQFHQEVK